MPGLHAVHSIGIKCDFWFAVKEGVGWFFRKRGLGPKMMRSCLGSSQWGVMVFAALWNFQHKGKQPQKSVVGLFE
jgi:hypothetical protein